MAENGGEGVIQRFKTWRLVRLSLSLIERLLSVVEFVIVPNWGNKNECSQLDSPLKTDADSGSLPQLVKIRFFADSSSNEVVGTPDKSRMNDHQTLRMLETPAMSETSIFDKSNLSTIEEASQTNVSTLSSPATSNIRNQMASKIRSWRQLIRNLDGTPQFPASSAASWPTSSPNSSANQSVSLEKSWIGSIWHSLSGWFFNSPFKNDPTAQRKRKRLEGDDDDLTLYIPTHKGHPGIMHSSSPVPKIKGLSTDVPLIGDWPSLTPETSTLQPADDLSSTDTIQAQEDVDHISLVQRNSDESLDSSHLSIDEK